MQTFLKKLCKALQKRFHGAKYFVSDVDFSANRRTQAPLWLNFRAGDIVMGIDFCNCPKKEDSLLEVSFFKRSSFQLDKPSAVAPMSHAEWDCMLPSKTPLALMNYQWRGDKPQGGGVRAGTCYDIHFVGMKEILCDMAKVVNRIQRNVGGNCIDRFLAVLGLCRIKS